MDFRKLFYDREENIPQIDEVAEAEDAISELQKRLKKLDKGLADEFETAIGRIAWNYEKQGFNGGLMAAKGAL